MFITQSTILPEEEGEKELQRKRKTTIDLVTLHSKITAKAGAMDLFDLLPNESDHPDENGDLKRIRFGEA